MHIYWIPRLRIVNDFHIISTACHFKKFEVASTNFSRMNTRCWRSLNIYVHALTYRGPSRSCWYLKTSVVFGKTRKWTAQTLGERFITNLSLLAGRIRCVENCEISEMRSPFASFRSSEAYTAYAISYKLSELWLSNYMRRQPYRTFRGDCVEGNQDIRISSLPLLGGLCNSPGVLCGPMYWLLPVLCLFRSISPKDQVAI